MGNRPAILARGPPYGHDRPFAFSQSPFGIVGILQQARRVQNRAARGATRKGDLRADSLTDETPIRISALTTMRSYPCSFATVEGASAIKRARIDENRSISPMRTTFAFVDKRYMSRPAIRAMMRM
jgi:hypothetical protein